MLSCRASLYRSSDIVLHLDHLDKFKVAMLEDPGTDVLNDW